MRERELLVRRLVHEVNLGAVVVEVLHALRLGEDAGELLPARKVFSTTAPVSMFFTFVRTNAPPLPGFTCWNSTMRQTPPSSSICIPFLNWLVLTVSAIGGQG